jgi:hypothetical protein
MRSLALVVDFWNEQAVAFCRDYLCDHLAKIACRDYLCDRLAKIAIAVCRDYWCDRFVDCQWIKKSDQPKSIMPAKLPVRLKLIAPMADSIAKN